MAAIGTDVDAYGAMIVGFWSVQFLTGWGGVILTFFSILLVAYKFFRLVVKDIRDRKKKKRKK